jgi:aconitate hydratase
MSVMREEFHKALSAPVRDRGYELEPAAVAAEVTMGTNGGTAILRHGAVVIAAITSCTNTSNPSVMVAAGLLARNAVEKGLSVKPYVKTSLAPGSRVVTEYLRAANLLDPLSKLGFNVVAYGCTTCIGNSGPLPGEVAKAVTAGDLVAAAVLSGNRNFEGRINPLVRASYLASPPLVVAYALAGRVDIDLDQEPLGTDKQGQPVYLRDLWPTQREISETVERSLTSGMFTEKYASVFEGSEMWQAIQVTGGGLFEWKEDSSYIHHPPYFQDLSLDVPGLLDIQSARVLAMFGDSVNTDNISPAGSIAAESPAGMFLQERGIQPRDFNSYGSRRGNDLVMARGTFANIRLKNLLVAPREGNWTRHFPDGAEMPIFDAAMQYQRERNACIILAGKEYGAGSSRDWAAKGPKLQGVQAIIAESFERIHRSNLVGMGILPLLFANGQGIESLGLKGDESYDILGLNESLQPRSTLDVRATTPSGKRIEFKVTAFLNTRVEVTYYRNGGILNTVLRNILR